MSKHIGPQASHADKCSWLRHCGLSGQSTSSYPHAHLIDNIWQCRNEFHEFLSAATSGYAPDVAGDGRSDALADMARTRPPLHDDFWKSLCGPHLWFDSLVHRSIWTLEQGRHA